MQIEITVIRTDGGTQPRATYHYGQVDAYAEDMEAGANFPPVIVFFDGDDYWLADGFHRLLAARKVGRGEIDADVRQGTLRDAQWYSYSVNQAHGLRRSNDDKRRAVEAALRHEYASRYSSDREIADHCGVSNTFVSNIRHEIEATVNGLQSKSRTGRDGRTINTSNIGRKKQPTAPKPEPEEEEPLSAYEESVAAQYSVNTPISEPCRVAPEVLTSEVDRLIAQYNYDDLCQLLEMLSERVGVGVA